MRSVFAHDVDGQLSCLPEFASALSIWPVEGTQTDLQFFFSNIVFTCFSVCLQLLTVSFKFLTDVYNCFTDVYMVFTVFLTLVYSCLQLFTAVLCFLYCSQCFIVSFTLQYVFFTVC